MNNLIRNLFKKELHKNYFKIFIIIIVVTSFIFILFSYKNYKIKEYNIFEIEEKIDKNSFNKIYTKGKYSNYLNQYEKYSNFINKKNKINQVKKDTKFYILDDVIKLQVFLSILGIIIGSSIFYSEYNSGIIKYTMTKGISRTKVFISYLFTLIYLILLLNFILFFTSIIFYILISGNLSILFFKTPIYTSKIIYINYLFLLFLKLHLYLLPIIFLSTISYFITVCTCNNLYGIICSLFLNVFGLLIVKWFLGFKFRIISYTFLPYLDFTVFNNLLDVIDFNIYYGVNLNIISGIIYIFIMFVILFILSLNVFIKKDIK